MQITFNTSRLYTAEGQIITARYVKEDKKVYFNDESRMIYDRMMTMLFDPVNARDLATTLMKAYDEGRHEWAPYEKRVKRDPDAMTHQFRL